MLDLNREIFKVQPPEATRGEPKHPAVDAVMLLPFGLPKFKAFLSNRKIIICLYFGGGRHKMQLAKADSI